MTSKSISIDELNAQFSGKRVVVSSSQTTTWVRDADGVCRQFVECRNHIDIVLDNGWSLGIIPDTLTPTSVEGLIGTTKAKIHGRRKIEII